MTNPKSGDTDVTGCIPYHAPASVVEAELDGLEAVSDLGGVAVTRAGDPYSGRWNYGYIYKIVFDAAADLYPTGLTLTHLQMNCQGSGEDCGCAEVVAKHPVNKDVQHYCRDALDPVRRGANASKTDPTACMVIPDMTMSSLHVGGQATVTGNGGALMTTGGMHRMPSEFSSANEGAGLRIAGGNAYVLSATMRVPYVYVSAGTFIAGGSTFMGTDLAKKLYLDASADRRETLTHVPFNGTVLNALRIIGGEVRIAAADFYSGISASTVLFSAGLISGWSTITANRALYVRGSATKYMRSAARLTCAANCEGEWVGTGDVYLREGASWFVRGKMTYGVRGNASGAVNATYGDVAVTWDSFRTGWAEGRQWSGNYWYTNPICGPHCARSPYLLNTGKITVPKLSRPVVGLTLRHLGVAIVPEGAR